MNITWCNTRPNGLMRADVSISITGDKERIILRISGGAMATKFKNADHIRIGFDNFNSVLAIASGDGGGFKVKRNKDGSAVTTISVKHIQDHVKPHELLGDYYLKRDEESGFYYVPIGALCHR